MTAGSNTFYFAYDQVGTIKAVIDSNGVTVKAIDYDSFGKVISDSNRSLITYLGFQSALYDNDTQLTRFGYRDYDAVTGKW